MKCHTNKYIMKVRQEQDNNYETHNTTTDFITIN